MFTRTFKHCTLFPLDYIYNNCYFICDQLDRRRVAVQTRGCVGRVHTESIINVQQRLQKTKSASIIALLYNHTSAILALHLYY